MAKSDYNQLLDMTMDVSKQINDISISLVKHEAKIDNVKDELGNARADIKIVHIRVDGILENCSRHMLNEKSKGVGRNSDGTLIDINNGDGAFKRWIKGKERRRWEILLIVFGAFATIVATSASKIMLAIHNIIKP